VKGDPPSPEATEDKKLKWGDCEEADEVSEAPFQLSSLSFPSPYLHVVPLLDHGGHLVRVIQCCIIQVCMMHGRHEPGAWQMCG